MEWECSESLCEDEDEQMDLRQSTSSALTRVSKRVGAWSENDRSRNFVDTLGNPTLPAQWTSPILLNGLVPGSGGSQRIGRQTVIDTIRIRYFNNTAANCRYVLVFDHQANGATPAVTDVFQTDNYFSEINYSYRDRFEIIHDLVIPVNGGENHYEEVLELELPTFYNGGSAGTVADIATGALYLMMNDSSALGTSAPFYGIRLEYEE